MTHHDFYTCDDCGRQLPGERIYMLERPGPFTLSEKLPEIIHACSTGCLVRLAAELHHGGDAT